MKFLSSIYFQIIKNMVRFVSAIASQINLKLIVIIKKPINPPMMCPDFSKIAPFEKSDAILFFSFAISNVSITHALPAPVLNVQAISPNIQNGTINQNSLKRKIPKNAMNIKKKEIIRDFFLES